MLIVKANEILQSLWETQKHKHEMQNRFLCSFGF